MDKKALRKEIREKKQAMSPQEIEEKSQALAEQFLQSELYRNAKSIYGYLPYNQEVRTTAMLRQAQKMQEDAARVQQELEEKEYSAAAGGGAVRATVNGKHALTALTINPEVVDADDIEMLEDLILVAVNDVMKKIDSANQTKLGQLTGGMNIPGLF